MSNSLATRSRQLEVVNDSGEVLAVARYSVPEIQTMAAQAAKSGLFGMTEPQAFSLMLIAEAEGIHPAKALLRYHIINGKPAIKAEAALGDMQRRGWLVEWLTEANDAAKQEARLSHSRHCPDGKLISFTMEDAKRAELWGKGNWLKYPSDMLRSKVSLRAARMLDPSVMAGMTGEEEASELAPPPPDPRGKVEKLTERLAARAQEAAPAPAEPEPATGLMPSDTETKQAVAWIKQHVAPLSKDEPAPPEPPQSVPDGEFKAWLRDECGKANYTIENYAKAEGVNPPRAVDVNQIGNALITSWIEADAIMESEVCGSNGKRDKKMVGAVLRDFWANENAEVREDVKAYLDLKIAEAGEVIRAAKKEKDASQAELPT